MLKIFLSGHTRGIGFQIYQYFNSKPGFQVVGGSRSNGFDISKVEERKKIVEASMFCEVIILCAHDKSFQADLLFDLFFAYRDKSKTIIVFGSESSNGIKDYPHAYALEKKHIESACEQLQNCDSNLKICLLAPGWVRTERVEKLTDENMLDLKELMNLLDFLINVPEKMVIKKILVSAKRNFNPENVRHAPWDQVKT